MLFQQTYAKSSSISHVGGKTLVDFAPDLSRDPTYFRGKIKDVIRYRDAMVALRDVVVSDFNFKPRDHSAYQAWVQEQYMLMIADQLKENAEMEKRLKKRMEKIYKRLRELNALRNERMKDFDVTLNTFTSKTRTCGGFLTPSLPLRLTKCFLRHFPWMNLRMDV